MGQTSAQRTAAHKARQQALGRSLFGAWVTPSEKQQLKELLFKLRTEKKGN